MSGFGLWFGLCLVLRSVFKGSVFGLGLGFGLVLGLGSMLGLRLG